MVPKALQLAQLKKHHIGARELWMQEELCPQQALEVVPSKRAALPGHLSAQQKTSSSSSSPGPSSQLPSPGEQGLAVHGCSFTLGPHRLWAAAAGRGPAGVSPIHPPCSAAAPSSLPDTIRSCTQHELQPSLSLPTNLF